MFILYIQLLEEYKGLKNLKPIDELTFTKTKKSYVYLCY